MPEGINYENQTHGNLMIWSRCNVKWVSKSWSSLRPSNVVSTRFGTQPRPNSASGVFCHFICVKNINMYKQHDMTNSQIPQNQSFFCLSQSEYVSPKTMQTKSEDASPKKIVIVLLQIRYFCPNSQKVLKCIFLYPSKFAYTTI